MSRIGKNPIRIPQGVQVNIQGQHVNIKGPKGTHSLDMHPRIKAQATKEQIVVERQSNARHDRSLHGLTRTLVNNIVRGVTEGYSKTLEITGVGFRAQAKGKTVGLSLGFSHPIDYAIPEGITVKTPKPTVIIVEGTDKSQVGEVAAELRRFFEPEPYKGKGIRYQDEQIRRKQGKTVG